MFGFPEITKILIVDSTFIGISYKTKLALLGGLTTVISVLGLYDKVESQNYSPLKSASSIDITIDGHVRDQNNAPINTANVKFYNKTTMTLQDEESTDGNGYYNAPFTYTGQDEKKTNLEEKLYPNPSNGQVNIDFNASREGTYPLTIYDIQGRLLYNSQVHVDQGANKITITGGDIGTHIINLTDNIKNHTFKSIQTSSTEANFTTDVTNDGMSMLKSDADGLDSLLIVYSKPGYVTKDTTVAPNTQTIDVKLEQLPTTFDFTAYALTINGDTIKPGNAINNVSINVKWGSDGTTINYPAVNGKIHIFRQEYGTPSTTIEVSNPDTTNVTEYTIGMKQDPLINTKEMNLFQNSKVHSGAPGTPYIPPGPATATILNLPSIFDIYFVPKFVEGADGIQYDTRGEVFRTVVQGGDPYVNRKFETTNNTIYWFEMQKDLSHPTNTIPDQQRLAQTQALDSVETLNYLHNGRQIYPTLQRVKIYTQTEPEWIAAQNRNWDQMLEFQYESEASNPGNSTIATPGGFGNIDRWKNGVANYQYTSSIGVTATEMIQALTMCRDPPSGNLTPLAYNVTTGLSKFIETVYDLRQIGNPNSDFW